MIEKGDLIELTYKTTVLRGNTNTMKAIYIGKNVVDAKFLFLDTENSLKPYLFDSDEILDVTLLQSRYNKNHYTYIGILDDAAIEKFRYWLTNQKTEFSLPDNLSNKLYKTAFRLLNIEQFKQYFLGDPSKLEVLLSLLKKGIAEEKINDFYGYNLFIAKCIDNDNTINEDTIDEFINFVNINLKSDKREQGLTTEESNYFLYLSHAISNGADYRDYQNDRLTDYLMHWMWDSASKNEYRVVLYSKLLKSKLSSNCILNLLNTYENILLNMSVEQLNFILVQEDTVSDETFDCLSLMRAYSSRFALYYKDEMVKETVKAAYEERSSKVFEALYNKDTTQKVNPHSIFK